MGDIGERPPVHQRRRAADRLDQIGQYGLGQQRRHGPGGLQVTRRDRLACRIASDDNPAQPFDEVCRTIRQTQDRHDLAGDGDVEPAFAHRPVLAVTQSHGHLAQRPVVHVHDPSPGDLSRVKTGSTAPVELIVDHGRQQIVRR